MDAEEAVTIGRRLRLIRPAKGMSLAGGRRARGYPAASGATSASHSLLALPGV